MENITDKPHTVDRDLSINNPCPWAVPSGSGGLWTINPCLLWFIYNIYSTSPLFLWQQVGIIFHILTGSCRFCRFCSTYPRSCKMMFPISYLVYSVNYFTCLLITCLVYNENYHACLLIITRTNHSGEYNR